MSLHGFTCQQCGVKYEAKRATSRFCSDTCRQRAKRDKVSVTQTQPVTLRTGPNVTVNVLPEEVHGAKCNVTQAQADAYVRDITETNQPDADGSLIGPEVYYWPRNHPERLNWGEHMTAAQLKDAGLAANRVPIPGDWDYVGRVA